MIRQFPRLIYLLEREDGAFKVGSSAYPARRMRTLEDDQGFDFQVVQEWEHPAAFEFEMEIHRRLRRHKQAELADFGGTETYIVARDVVLAVINEVLKTWVSTEACLAAYDACGGDTRAAIAQLGLTSNRPMNKALKKRWAAEDRAAIEAIKERITNG